MCGRYLFRNQPDWALHTPWKQYWKDIRQFTPRYNIAPSQQCPIIIYKNDHPQLVVMQWGFRPSWARPSFAKINARGETLFSSKMFSQAAQHTRCLIPADGFYEPEGPSTLKKRPWHLFEYDDQRVFAMAGIWTHHQTDNENFLNFSIVTTEANEKISSVHHRMPVILEKNVWASWLTGTDKNILQSLLQSRDYQNMIHYPVGDHVKNPVNEGIECTRNDDPENLSLF